MTEWKILYNKLEEYNLENPFFANWLKFSISHGINPSTIVFLIATFTISLSVFIPQFFIFQNVFSLASFFVLLFGIFGIFSMGYSEFLHQLFYIDSLIKDNEFHKTSKISRTWTTNQLAIFGCIIKNPNKYEKPELGKIFKISERQIHRYCSNGILQRSNKGYIFSPPKFKIINYKSKLDKKKLKRIEKDLLELFKARCIFQYQLKK